MPLLAEVVGFDGDEAILAPIGDTGGLSAGAEVVPTGGVLQVPVGAGLLGRVVDGLGQPLDTAAHGPLPQGLFLQRLGLMSRAAMLARAAQMAGKGRDQAGLILSGAERLVAPERMGRLFKALCLCDPALPPPPGFEAA